MKHCTLLTILLFTTITSSAQGAFDLYLFQLEPSPGHKYSVSRPRYMSDFNPGGYTNQPAFTPDGNLLVSVRLEGSAQHDIYQLDVNDNTYRQLTETEFNEFSPAIHPDGNTLSILRQIEGDTLDQQVLLGSLDGKSFQSVTSRFRDVGYYTWMGRDQLAIIRVGEKVHHLVLLNLKLDISRRVASAVGRTLHSDGKGTVIYLDKTQTDKWYLTEYFPESDEFNPIIGIPGTAVDFAVGPDRTFFIGVAGKLYCFNAMHHTSWEEIADLSPMGIRQISRLAISPDGKQLALITSK